MSILGTWDISFKWNNMVSYDQAEAIFQTNGQVAIIQTGYGTAFGSWAEEAGLMLIRFDDGPRAVYTGNVALDSITGIQSTFYNLNQFNGFWYAIRKNNASKIPDAVLQAKKDNDEKYSPLARPEMDKV